MGIAPMGIDPLGIALVGIDTVWGDSLIHAPGLAISVIQSVAKLGHSAKLNATKTGV
jgi:hypothetical protein